MYTAIRLTEVLCFRSFGQNLRSCHVLIKRDHLSIGTPIILSKRVSEYTLPSPRRGTVTGARASALPTLWGPHLPSLLGYYQTRLNFGFKKLVLHITLSQTLNVASIQFFLFLLEGNISFLSF